jgi:hypothetical protein
MVISIRNEFTKDVQAPGAMEASTETRAGSHHLPPGTSKWNKIEHRLFSFITQNWRAKPLVSYRVIVDLIAATTTQTWLKVLCELDNKSYPKGIVVSNEEMASLNIKRADFHGEWNYTIAPSTNRAKRLFLTSP